MRQIQEVWGQQQFSQEEIAQVEGILYINAVEQPAEDGETTFSFRHDMFFFPHHDPFYVNQEAARPSSH